MQREAQDYASLDQFVEEELREIGLRPSRWSDLSERDRRAIKGRLAARCPAHLVDEAAANE